jgi:hypothetical protein
LDLTKVLKEPKTATAKSTAEKILAPVPYANGFHFFTSIGVYTGETAISLEHFTREIQTIPLESIEFHNKRGDFQKWIASTLGDDELAEEIGCFEKNLSGEALRKRLLTVLNARVNDLKTQMSQV